MFGEASGPEALEAMGSDPQTAGEVRRNWDRIKRQVERPDGEAASDPFADIPETLPALLYARKVLRRADPEGGAGKGGARSGETPPRGEARDAAEKRVGSLLLDAVELARELEVDPELALRAATDRHRKRVTSRTR